jgi:parallel beta-helix repeat protein
LSSSLRSRVQLPAAAIALAIPLALALAAPSQAATSTLGPVSDTYVNQSSPGTNYASSTTLRMDGSPVRRTLLKFQRPAGNITSLKLRIWKTGGTATSTITVKKATSESWTNRGVTWNNQPGRGALVASKTNPANGWVDFTIPVSALNASGTTTFVLERGNSDGVTITSWESTSDPHLAITTADATAPAPTPPPTTQPAPAPAPPTGCPSGSNVITSGSIASALSSTPAGGTLCLNGGTYSVGSTIAVDKNVTITGVNAPQLTQSFTGNFFRVGASNVTIRGLTMTGANRTRTGESCGGTGAVWVGAVSGTRIDSNVLDTFTCGIMLNGATSFSISGNRLSRVKYAGITTFPAANGTISSNTLTDVNHDGPLGQNAYGIVVSGNLSRGIVVSGNTVRNAPTWECFDTHDGQSIDFLNNTCIAPGRVGINHVNAGIADPSGRVEGNTIDAAGLGTQWNSITFGGTGTVNGNIIKGFGSCAIWSPKTSPSGNACS